MKLVIETWWEKTVDSGEIGKMSIVLKGDYEKKGAVSWDTDCTSSYALEKELTARFPNKFLGKDGQKLKFDLGTQYAIHSYQKVYIKDDDHAETCPSYLGGPVCNCASKGSAHRKYDPFK